MSEKQIKELKARANCAEHELAKLQLEKDTQEAVNHSLKQEILQLKSQNESLQHRIRDLEFTIQKQHKSINDLQNSSTDSNKEQQKILEKLKNSLADMESLVAYRASTSKKYLSKVLRILNSFTQHNSEPSAQYKINLKKFNREIVNCIEELGKIINSSGKIEFEPDSFKETLKEKDEIIEEYRDTLEKMREQMLVMRERLKDSNGDSEKKYKNLIVENEMLGKKVRFLEESLKEQSDFVSSLRDVFGVQAEEVNKIDDELAMVDQEIMDLQSSLSRALV